ncbi:MAG: ribonuclease HII [Succinivibrionaceae bacterium]|nr:ribonuclease HII [Succinivibrionaceae bacterium]
MSFSYPRDPAVCVFCGVDEVGRGPLVGNVVTAAVVLDPARPVSGLTDSKKLAPAKREKLYDLITANARAWAVGRASPAEIDELNILWATMLAMRRAVEALPFVPDHVLVDGNRVPELPCPATSVVKGDLLVPEISAASIVAKVTRDREMDELAKLYPEYGYESHRGYPTASHLEAIRRLGVHEHYRRSFRPVREVLELMGRQRQ